jgi:septation ring formation regulator
MKNLNFLTNIVLLDAWVTWTIVFSIVGIIFLAILIAVLDKFVFAKKRAEKTLHDIEKKYEYLHALLTGQDSQYIIRLEIISRTNLLYCDIHANFFKRFKELRDLQDQSFQEIVANLGEFVEENKISKFKDYYKRHRLAMQNFEENVNKLNDDLLAVIRPEEDARQACLLLKDKFRELKSKFNNNEHSLNYVKNSFNKVFDKIDEKFGSFEQLIENANYDDANKILPEVRKVMEVLDKAIDVIPGLITRTLDEEPFKIQETTNKYNELVAKKYPLVTLNVEAQIDQINIELNDIKDELLRLNLSHISERLDAINNHLSDIDKKLIEEENSKVIFDQKYQTVSLNFNMVEKEYIKITNNLQKIKKYYVIDGNHEKMLNEIKNDVDNTSKEKRRLETYVHAVEHTPYSMLVNQIKDLDNGTTTTNEKINTFKNYIASLKASSDNAFQNIRVKYGLIKENEAVFSSLNCSKEINSSINLIINKCYELIDSINDFLRVTPIDVNKVDEANTELNAKSSDLSKKISELKNFQELTTNNMLRINRDRLKFADINQSANQVETLYVGGKYKESYEMSLHVLERLQEKASNQ